MKKIDRAAFAKALPIWLSGLDKEMNVFAGFRAIAFRKKDENMKLRIAASSVYRCYANGVFVGHGPSAAPHGFYRVDEWEIPPMDDGDLIVAIEVAGYNVNSFYSLDQPSFVQAEIVREDGQTAAYTGGTDEAGFESGELTERIRKTQRYSFQRTFTEGYRLMAGYANWKTSASAALISPMAWSVTEDKSLLSRGIPYPDFSVRYPVSCVQRGNVSLQGPLDYYRKDRSLTGVGPAYLGYPADELVWIPSLFLQEVAADSRHEQNVNYAPDETVILGEHHYRIVDFGTNRTGFIGARVECSVPTRMFYMFDEVLTDGDIDFLRLDSVNIIGYEMLPGSYEIEAFEPNTMRYLKILVLEGEVQVRGIYLREYANADVGRASFSSGDPAIDAIFQAGVETYRQNSVDAFMDCPSRERAGWLCDSFFTARTAFDLSGHAGLERFFLDNYLLPSEYRHIPDGMLPMCYPADHYDGNFIPNWAMWFVVQLEEYVQRSGDESIAVAFEPRVSAIFRYFDGFRNEDGLLEKLDGWIFVECTEANEWVQDVSYPTNMLYAGALSAAARLYRWPERGKEAERLRSTIREQAYDGRFFVDHAVRKGPKLEPQNHISEVCQYYAFFFDVADRFAYPELWRTLVERFGPLHRGEDRPYPHIPHTNQLVGNFMRMEVLSREGNPDRIRAEWNAFFGHMAELTGTLWEHDGPAASCNHGFASHVVHVAYRDFLGVHNLDPIRRKIELRPGAVALNSCSGSFPVGDELLSVSWEIKDGHLIVRTDIPSDYEVTIKNMTDFNLIL